MSVGGQLAEGHLVSFTLRQVMTSMSFRFKHRLEHTYMPDILLSWHRDLLGWLLLVLSDP